MESVCLHDLEMLFKTFEISKGHSHVAYERNLVAKNSVDIEERQFDKFMKSCDGNPKFVFVVLMSQGFDNGVFLLADAHEDACCDYFNHACNQNKTERLRRSKHLVV